MADRDDGVKLELPKELIGHLHRAGPFWSTALGITVLSCGWLLHSPTVEGSGIAILAIGFLLLVSRQASRLTRKEAFLGVRNLFVGRDQECDLLMDAIRRAPLLWVSGESGSGKSSLLRLGISPRLADSREWLPVYINNWGTDWEAGPVASISSALRHAVESLGARLDIAAQPTAADLASYLKQTLSALRRTPVLILDQFDDYIVDNVERFRPAGGGLIVTADELMQQNVFWRELGGLLEADVVRCLFVVRQEPIFEQNLNHVESVF
jgi:AAA ATPase domain